MLRARMNRDDLREASYDTKQSKMTLSFKNGKVLHFDHAKESDFNGIIAAKRPRREYEDGFLPRYRRRMS